MTKEEYYSALNRRVISEYKDIVKYYALYEEATGIDKGVLRDIIKEERSHAKHLEYILQAVGKLDDNEEYQEIKEQALECMEDL